MNLCQRLFQTLTSRTKISAVQKCEGCSVFMKHEKGLGDGGYLKKAFALSMAELS